MGFLSGLKAQKANQGLMLVLGLQAVYMIMFSGFETSFSVFTYQNFQFTELMNSRLFLYLGILALLIQGGMMRLKTKQFFNFILLGLFLAAISFLALSINTSKSGLYEILILFSIGIALLNIHLPSLASLHSSEDNRGQVMGLYESIGSLSRIIGPFMIYGLFMGDLNEGYRLFAGILLVTLLLAYILRKRIVPPHSFETKISN